MTTLSMIPKLSRKLLTKYKPINELSNPRHYSCAASGSRRTTTGRMARPENAHADEVFNMDAKMNVKMMYDCYRYETYRDLSDIKVT